MYYIYHIPTYVWKDGSIGKIGCSYQHKFRIKKQGYSDYEILEEHSCIYKASDRERELQKEYGYPVDKIPYWKSVKNAKKGSMTDSKIRGKLSGKISVESGHVKRMGKLSAKKRSKPVIQYDLEGSYIAEWKSITDAHNKLGIPRSTIRKVCTGKYKKSGGFIWKFKK